MKRERERHEVDGVNMSIKLLYLFYLPNLTLKNNKGCGFKRKTTIIFNDIFLLTPVYVNPLCCRKKTPV